MVVAVGLTEDGQKISLRLREGDTENPGVVKDLLSSISARNFTFAASSILAVLDGGKALQPAVRALWGDMEVIQRCWVHKVRSLRDYMPKNTHGQIAWRMKKIMGLNSYELTKKELDSMIGVVKWKTKNVKNWSYHPKTSSKVKRDKALRWVASSIQAQSPKLRRLKGASEHVATLIRSLNELAAKKKSA